MFRCPRLDTSSTSTYVLLLVNLISFPPGRTWQIKVENAPLYDQRHCLVTTTRIPNLLRVSKMVSIGRYLFDTTGISAELQLTVYLIGAK
ncbi:hypothetical protein BJ912DRAFT_319527 [Pholiota molesta]|nr:hypothetical protein BJ912DRAFT_319527 [Pholiota molesta]